MFGERGPAYEGDSQTFRLEKRTLPLPLPQVEEGGANEKGVERTRGRGINSCCGSEPHMFNQTAENI